MDSDQLLQELFNAYYTARKNKRNTINQLRFELNFESNLLDLRDEIISRSYKIRPGVAFIIEKPVKREVIAADFRDRVVHHLLFALINPVFEPTFIPNSFSCRKGKGTHYGISALESAISTCSQGYKQPCYILKLDISGYFMSMHKGLLEDILFDEIRRSSLLPNDDKDLCMYLIAQILKDDPTQNCRIKGKKSDWQGLPPSKSLFHAEPMCGLPIGNLTSQLFSNIYLNDFDHYVTETLGFPYYGRYVDDFYLVHNDSGLLKYAIGEIRKYLLETRRLKLHPGKIYLQPHTKGVNFLGATLKPFRRYVSKRTKHNFTQSVRNWENLLARETPDKTQLHRLRSTLNSYLGIMKHFRTYNIRKKVLLENQPKAFLKYGYLKSVKYKYMVFCLYKKRKADST